MKQSLSNILSNIEFGIWIDGLFCWINPDDWNYEVNHNKEGEQTWISRSLNLSVTLTISQYEGAILQTCTLQNMLPKQRQIKLFLNQKLTNHHDSITFYAPSIQAIVCSFDDHYLLLNGLLKERGIVQYCTDFADCSLIEEGFVAIQPFSLNSEKSIISLEAELTDYEKVDAYFWLCTGENEEEIVNNNELTKVAIPLCKSTVSTK